MADVAVYIAGAVLPDLQLWWPTPDGSGWVDFHAGYTFAVKVGPVGGGTAAFTKTTGITGTAASGDPDTPGSTSNIIVAWTSADIATLPVGAYWGEVIASRASDSEPRKRRFELQIVATLT